MGILMEKLSLIMAVLLIGASFAIADSCREKIDEAKKMYTKCKSIGKGNPGYAQCSDSYKIL